jgi:hypothetical protein
MKACLECISLSVILVESSWTIFVVKVGYMYDIESWDMRYLQGGTGI